MFVCWCRSRQGVHALHYIRLLFAPHPPMYTIAPAAQHRCCFYAFSRQNIYNTKHWISLLLLRYLACDATTCIRMAFHASVAFVVVDYDGRRRFVSCMGSSASSWLSVLLDALLHHCCICGERWGWWWKGGNWRQAGRMHVVDEKRGSHSNTTSRRRLLQLTILGLAGVHQQSLNGGGGKGATTQTQLMIVNDGGGRNNSTGPFKKRGGGIL